MSPNSNNVRDCGHVQMPHFEMKCTCAGESEVQLLLLLGGGGGGGGGRHGRKLKVIKWQLQVT